MFLSVIGLSLASLFVLGVITFIIKYGTWTYINHSRFCANSLQPFITSKSKKASKQDKKQAEQNKGKPRDVSFWIPKTYDFKISKVVSL